MIFKKGDRVLARTSPYSMQDHLGTVLAIANTDACLVEIDEDGSTKEVNEDNLCLVREETRTDPSSCNYQLVCKNCGWYGNGTHVWFAPHYCLEPATRDGKPIPKDSQVFEAKTITPIRHKRPDGSKIDRKYMDAMMIFDPSVLKGKTQ